MLSVVFVYPVENRRACVSIPLKICFRNGLGREKNYETSFCHCCQSPCHLYHISTASTLAGMCLFHVGSLSAQRKQRTRGSVAFRNPVNSGKGHVPCFFFEELGRQFASSVVFLPHTCQRIEL